MNRILLIFLFSVLVACKKEKAPAEIAVANISNGISGGLNYKLYASYENYMYDRNAIASGKADSGVTVLVNIEGVRNSEYLYYDLYTDNYRITNWTANYKRRSQDVIRDSHIFYNTTLVEVGIARRYYIDEGKRETVWHAVDALDQNGQSVWQDYPYYANIEVALMKDATFFLEGYYQTPVFGHFRLNDYIGPDALILDDEHYMWLDYPEGHPHHGVRPVADTAMFAINGGGPIIVLVKE